MQSEPWYTKEFWRRARVVGGVILLSILFFTAVLFGVYFLPCSLGMKAMLTVLAFSLGLFLVLVGADFFIVYLKRSIVALLLLYGVAFVSMFVMHASGPNSAELINLSTPGTVLSLFGATVTVVGFTITITRLHESHVRISSYEEFLVRLARLLQVALQDHRVPMGWINRIELHVRSWFKAGVHDHEGLKILCSVPTLGNLSHHNLFFARVYSLWKQVAWCEALKVEMICINAALPNSSICWDDICPQGASGLYSYDKENFTKSSAKYSKRKEVLDQTPVGNFYSKMLARRGFEEWEICRGVIESVDIFRELNGHGQNNEIIPYPWHDGDALPPIHLFWTRSRAIVAVPLDRGIRSDMERGRVTMVGYETTDTRVIERLWEVYQEWRIEAATRKSREDAKSRQATPV